MQNPEAFVHDMKSLFDGLDLDSISENTSEIISEMMEKIRQHQVNLKGGCALTQPGGVLAQKNRG